MVLMTGDRVTTGEYLAATRITRPMEHQNPSIHPNPDGRSAILYDKSRAKLARRFNQFFDVFLSCHLASRPGGILHRGLDHQAE